MIHRFVSTSRLGRVRLYILVLLGLLLVGAALLAIVVVVGGPRFVQYVREYDSSRPLINEYELWLLKGHPREIMLGSSSGPTTTPSNWQNRSHEVGNYAIIGDVIVGELDPLWGLTGPPTTSTTRFFILDTTSHDLDEFDIHIDWRRALKQLGIRFDSLDWKY
jgi:hypothetical protein